MTEPPLSPGRTQWSDDGTRWWDGSAWFPRREVPVRQAELEREAQAHHQQQQADYAHQYAEWQHQQAAGAADPTSAGPFAPPGSGTAPPPLPPGMVLTAETVPGARPTGYALGLWSFATAGVGVACAGLGVLLFGPPGLAGVSLVWALVGLPAVILGHLSRKQARKARLTLNIWGRWGLFFGYLELAGVAVVVALVVWVATSLEYGPIGHSLTVAAQAQQYYHAAYGTYARSTTELAPTRYSPAPGVTVTVEQASADAFCLRAQEGTEVRWLANGGEVSKTPCR